MPRPGSAGSNTAGDHVKVLDAAIAALPPACRRRLMVTCVIRGRNRASATDGDGIFLPVSKAVADGLSEVCPRRQITSAGARLWLLGSRSALYRPALDHDPAGVTGLSVAASVTDASAMGMSWEHTNFDLENPR